MQDITPFQYLTNNFLQQTNSGTKGYYVTKMGLLLQMCYAFENDKKHKVIEISNKELFKESIKVEKPSKLLLDYANRIKLYKLQKIYDSDSSQSLTKKYKEKISADNKYKVNVKSVLNPLTLRRVFEDLYKFEILMSVISSSMIIGYEKFNGDTLNTVINMNTKDF